MHFGEASREMPLPGFDAFHDDSRNNLYEPEINPELLAPGSAYRALLANASYAEYMKMHKVLVNHSGARHLIDIGGKLEEENHPEYLEAAGWAFAESALANDSMSTHARLDLLDRADANWKLALQAYDSMELTEYAEKWRDDSRPFRLALNIAYTPIVRSIVLGDITDETRRKVLTDTLAIAQLAETHRTLADKCGYGKATCELYGFMHECNIMASFLLLDNPAYVPIPSTNRADNGLYHRKQTHDISLINQHFGEIRKLIPIEAKKENHIRNVRRYDAMLVTRSDLSIDGDKTIEEILHMLSNVFENTATYDEKCEFGVVRARIRKRVTKYQRQQQTPEHAFDTRTEFHGTKATRVMAYRAIQAAERAKALAS